MSDKTFFVDLSKCTGCRACQIACKQWKQLPAEATRQTGTHQNPPDMSGVTLKIVRFKEVVLDGGLKLLYMADQCRHCVDPPCKAAGDDIIKDAIEQDKDTGAVLYTERTKGLPFEVIKGACPYDIPRLNDQTKVITKCDMCNDRVTAGMLPACVKTCPTGTMNFGDRADMLDLAQKRLAVVKATKPKAYLVDIDQVRVVFLAEYEAKHYATTLMADATGPKAYSRFAVMDSLLGPLRRQARG